MKKFYFLLFALVFSGLSSYCQMFILNEDFSGTSGTTPPGGWNNIMISGTATDLWHFDNPGYRTINYPVTEPFAIFDAEAVSGNGTPETAALESPVFDASISNFILLNFQHTLVQGAGATGIVEAFNGNSWQQIASFSSSTLNPESEILDLSSAVGGVTNARIRFTWSGNGLGYWAIDNIRIYASLPLDAGVVSLDNPLSPVTPGVHNVAITLGNFGYNTLNSTTVHWKVDGVTQTPFSWNGSISFGQTLSNIVIGTYNFQDPVVVQIWQTSPNGQTDPNPYNDTISVYVKTTLCGTYTIGGPNPDFETFSDVASVLNDAGVTCPVTFLVRDGIYYEQFILRNIPGASATNTITFRSESGDSTLAVLQIDPGAQKYEPMIWLEGTKYVRFEGLGMFTGSNVSYANNALFLEGASHIGVNNCYFEGRRQFDFCIQAQSGSQQIDIGNSRFRSVSSRAGAIHITDENTREINIHGNIVDGAGEWGYTTLRIADGAARITVDGNYFAECYRAIYLVRSDSVEVTGNIITNTNEGVYVDDMCTSTRISENRLIEIESHPNVPDGTAGITVNEAGTTAIFNNFVHTTGTGPVMGLRLTKSSNLQVDFNSVNITNTDQQKQSKAILLSEIAGMSALNNIFSISIAGTPVSISGSSGLVFDRNDYYNFDPVIGTYNGTVYTNLQAWKNATGMDNNSVSVIPFFTSPTNLSINQALLNNTGTPVGGITTDIDGTLRNPVNPDIGAKEYSPCPVDAGINAVTSPQNPLGIGVTPVRVLLQNQGAATLTSARLNWQVNDQVQAPFDWNGSLPAAGNTEVQVGTYNIQAGELYVIKAWTTNPNNGSDCNPLNDTIFSPKLAAPLCGTYTIGGTSPDFTSFSEAVSILNQAGITCPVIFNVRNGTYLEQFTLAQVPGTSATNTITFRSESGDSTQAVIRIVPEAQKYETMVTLSETQYVIFRQLGLFTGSETSFDNDAVILDGAANIIFDRCYFELAKESDLGIGIRGSSHGITVENCRIECINARSMALNVEDDGTRDIEITGNIIMGATENGSQTIRLGTGARALDLTANHIERCYEAVYIVGTDSVNLRNNLITSSNIGIVVDNFSKVTEISGNRLLGILSHEDDPEGTAAISVQNAASTHIYNNFIQTAGNGAIFGINLLSVASCRISYNSINITNEDPQGLCTGIRFAGNTNEVYTRNNIFNISKAGIPVNILTATPQLDFDHNDYFSFDGTIGYYNGSRYDRIEDWSAVTGMDMNSISAIPFFSSETDLAINQVLLNNAGTPVAGVTTDIDGTLRNASTPDIGAREYNPCQTDAGINAVLGPVNPLTIGTHPVKVQLQNQGTAALNTVQINWQVNGQNQPAFDWTGSLPAGANTEVEIGQFNFQSGQLFVITAWTANPNGTSDCNNKNDQVSSRNLATPLCGTYTIGGNAPDFASFAEAITVLNEAGIDCAVTFLVRDGEYYERLILGKVPGASEGNPIKFTSESGDSTRAVLMILPEALKNEALLRLEGTQHLTISRLGLSTGANTGILNNAIFMEGTSRVVVENCHIKAINESDIGIDIQGGSHDIRILNNRFECPDFKAGAINAEGAGTRNIEVSGNHITGSSLRGNTLVRIYNGTRNISLSDNRIESGYRLVFISNSDSIAAKGNFFNNAHDGIYIIGTGKHINISENRLTNIRSHQNAPDGTNGIFLQNIQGADIINNFIHTMGTGPVLGINLQQVDSCRVLYNSITVANTDAQGRSKGLYMTGTSHIASRNNIFNVRTNGIPIHIDLNVSGFTPDYNDYYHPLGVIGKIENTTYNNLYNWGLAVNGDANAMAVNPYFAGDTIPLPFQRALNGAGIPIPGILTDIDGKIRFAQAPDVGCIEFTVDYGVLDLLSPDLNCFHDESDSVTVLLKMFGDVPFSELKVAYKLDNGPVHIDTIPGPVFGDIIHTFSTLENISAEGEYLFTIWLINTLDDNINNDTLKAWRYSKPSPVVSIDYDNFCTGWTVSFFGSATVEAPYYIASYEWLFGDGETSLDQNPVHKYLQAGTYIVTLRAYSDVGCFGYTTMEVIIDPGFQGLSMNYNLINENCYRDSTGSLEIIPSGGYPPYTVYLNDQPVSNYLITGLTTGTYVIRIVDSENCTVTDTVESFSTFFMDPQIIASPLSGMTPLTVQFDFTANDPANWIWFFNETETDTSHSPEYTFLDYGSYLVILEVTGGHPHYCVERDTVEIFVDIIVTIDVNTVFTPNGDGYNDFFEIKTTAVRELNAKIYNRWGNKVFEIEEVGGKWDGNTKGGAELPDGTYFYDILAKGYDNKDYEKSGAVLLLRHAAQAYPNPASSRVKVQVFGPLDPPAYFEAYSVFGQVALTGSLNDPGNIDIDLSTLSEGIYMLKVYDKSRHYYVRIIKN